VSHLQIQGRAWGSGLTSFGREDHAVGRVAFSAEGRVAFSAEGRVAFSAEGRVAFSAEGRVAFSAEGRVAFSAEGLVAFSAVHWVACVVEHRRCVGRVALGRRPMRLIIMISRGVFVCPSCAFAGLRRRLECRRLECRKSLSDIRRATWRRCSRADGRQRKSRRRSAGIAQFGGFRPTLEVISTRKQWWVGGQPRSFVE
jgi:hypothetical protein